MCMKTKSIHVVDVLVWALFYLVDVQLLCIWRGVKWEYGGC